MKPTARFRSFLLASSAVLAAPALHAATLTWDANGTGALQTDGLGTWLTANQWWNGSANVNWNSATPDDAVIGNGGAGGAITVGTLTAGTINLNNFTGTYTIQGTGTTLTTTGGITIGATAGNVTFRGTGTLANQLTIAGAGGITMNGSGVLNLRENVVTSYTGATTINSGIVLLNAGSKSTGNFNLNGGMVTDYFQQTGVFSGGLGTGTNQIQVHGNSGFGAGNGGSIWRIGSAGSILTWGSTHFDPTTLRFMTAADNLGPTIYGTAVLDNGLDLGAAARTIDVLNASANPATSGARINGVISNGSLIKTGGGNLVLNSAANTYGGTTTISAGFLSVATLANGGSNSSIGSSSAAASNLLLGNGATFRYTGGAVSTNRSFTINGTAAGHGAALDASGTGAVNFTATTTPAYGTVDQTRTLTLTGTNTGNNTLAALIADNGTGAVSLTKSGTGTWIISNAGNNYTGPTTITGGALVLNSAAALPGGIGATGGTSNLTFNGGVLGLTSTDFTRDLNTAATPAAATFTGAGGWAAFGADRNVNLNNDTHQITWATANTGFGGFNLILGNVSATHKITFQNAIQLGTAARTVQVDNGTGSVDAELSGVISSSSTAGGLTKTGAGTLSLSNANLYTGVTTVSGGVLLLSNTNALPGGIGATGGTNNLIINTGAVVGLGDGNFSRGIGTGATQFQFGTGGGGWAAFNADRQVNIGGSAGTVTWGNSIATGGFNSLLLVLGATSATHTVDLVNPLALGNAARTVQVENGAATVDAILSGNISGTGGSINKTGGGLLLISGNMSQTGGLTVNDGAPLTLSGTNTYSGQTSFSGGNPTLTFAGIQAVSPNTTFLMNTNASTAASTVRLLDDTGGVNNSTVTAPSTFRIQNNNSPGNAHTFIVGNNNTANGGTSSGTTTGSTIAIGTLDWGSYASGTTAYGPIQIQGTNGYRLQIDSVVLHNAANLASNVVGSTFFTPTTANVTLGTVTVGTGNVNLGLQTLVLDGTSSDNRVTGAISNASDFGTSNRALSLTKSNSSIWTLSGASTYTGTTAVNGGTLIGTNATQSFGTNLSGISIAAAGTLSLRNDSTVSFTNGTSAYNIANSASGATINVDRVSGTGSNTITVGNLTTSSTSGVWGLNFTGANGVSLSTATLNTPVSTIAATHTITNNITGGGSLTLASVFNQATTLASPDLVFTGTGNTIVTSAITQTLATMDLIKSGAGALTLNGANSYTGATVVQAGNLIAGTSSLVSTDGAFGNAASEINLGLAGGNSDAGILAGGAYTIGRDIRLLTNNTTDTGTRIITLGGNTDHNSIFSGNIILGTASQAGRGVTLTAATGGQVTFSGVIQNPSSMDATTYTVTKTGGGTVLFTNTNTYTGATAVNAGTLEVALGGSTHASSAVTVSNSGSALVVNGTVGGSLLANANTTISGTGTVTGAATINGNLTPGNSAGLLSFGNSLALANTTATTMEIAGTTLGIDYDAISVGTGLTYDGALTLALGATFGAGSYTFNLFDFGSQSGSFDAIALSGSYSGSLTNSLGVWTATTNSGNETWTFTQSTGDLGLVVIPEPRAALLGGLGLLMLLRRRR